MHLVVRVVAPVVAGDFVRSRPKDAIVCIGLHQSGFGTCCCVGSRHNLSLPRSFVVQMLY
jgi:hypothetical protein